MNKPAPKNHWMPPLLPPAICGGYAWRGPVASGRIQTDPLPLFGEWLSLTLGEGGSVGIRVLVGVDGEDVLQAHQREQPVRDRRRVSQDERSAVLGEFPSRVNQDLDA
jgi:hypothetical protein